MSREDLLLKLAKPIPIGSVMDPVEGWEPPTDKQKEAGNYEKPSFWWRGMQISIENPVGSTRSGVTAAGKAWKTVMKNPYGYIKGTTGFDGDHLDVFVGPKLDSYMVYVIDQKNPTTGEFDEHKCVIGVRTKDEARAVYDANFQKGWDGFSGITSMPVPVFKEWAFGEIQGALKVARFLGYVTGSTTQA